MRKTVPLLFSSAATLAVVMAMTLVVASGVALAVSKLGTNGPQRCRRGELRCSFGCSLHRVVSVRVEDLIRHPQDEEHRPEPPGARKEGPVPNESTAADPTKAVATDSKTK